MTVDRIPGTTLPRPNHVSRRARELAMYDEEPTDSDSPDVWTTWRHLLDRVPGGDSDPLGPRPAIDHAFTIHENPAFRIVVRGLILANQSAQEIATSLGMPAEAIETYERVFWDVRAYLDRKMAVYVLLRWCDLEGDELSQLQAAYSFGAGVFSQILGVTEMAPETAPRLRRWMATENIRHALAACSKLPDSDRSRQQALRSFLKLRELEMRETRMQQKQAREQRQFELEKQKIEAQQRHIAEMRQSLRAQTRDLARQRKAFERDRKHSAELLEAATRRADEPAPIATPNLAALRFAERESHAYDVA